MSIGNQGWFDWAAERWPGPADKKYSQVNASAGVVPHSMEGSYGGSLGRLMSLERDAQGQYTEYAAASWTGSVLTTGKLIQHYPITVSTWTSGNRMANTRFNAFEFEGRAGTPFTDEQTRTLVRIIHELSALRGWLPSRPLSARDENATLYEHHECITLWGGRATACPSNRVPWAIVLEALKEDDEMAAPILLKIQGDRRVLRTDGVSSWHVPDQAVLNQLRFLGASPVVELPAAYAPLFDALWKIRHRTVDGAL